MNSQETARLHALTSRFCDGEIAPVDMEELNALIVGDQSAASEYVALTALHLSLGRKLRGTSRASVEGDFLGEPIREIHDRSPSLAITAGHKRSSVQRFILTAIAASLLIATASLLILAKHGSTYTAQITSSVDCGATDELPWNRFEKNLKVGDEIRLSRGLMTVEFGDGAEVVVEAPVHFVILGQNRGRLLSGRLTAVVPPPAHGFAIEMPSATIVDLGTNFGAYVAENGICEAHVFEGSVRVESSRADLRQKDWMLSSGNALRFPARSGSAEELTADPAAFVHANRFLDPAPSAADSSVAIASGSSLILWLDAAKGLQLDSANRVVGWSDQTSYGNSIADNAWQSDARFRPTWVPNAIGAFPGVRFNGVAHLITTTLATSNTTTIVCVLKGSSEPALDMQTGEVLNFNGPHNLVVEYTPQQRIVGKLVSTPATTPTASSSKISYSLTDTPSLCVVAYVYDYSTNESRLYVNGELVGTSNATEPIRAESERFVGASNLMNRGFVGTLGELLVFDSALSTDDCRKLSMGLMDKYDIRMDENEPRVLSRLRPTED